MLGSHGKVWRRKAIMANAAIASKSLIRFLRTYTVIKASNPIGDLCESLPSSKTSGAFRSETDRR